MTRRRQHGYTILELAVVLTIVSLVVGMSVSAGLTQLEVARNGSTKGTLETAREALLVYQKKYGRFPCPADPALVSTDPAYGQEATVTCSSVCAPLTCIDNAVTGMIPFKAIKLNAESAVDAWDRKITYVVDKDHTAQSHYELGKLKVLDANGQEISSSPTLGDAIFVLISHGEDGGGAYNKASAAPLTCDAAHKDASNCDGADDQFIDDRLNNNLEVPANYFDDIVVWQTQENLDIANPAADAADCDKPISGGYRISCTVASNGTPYCWGDNTKGAYGNNDTVSSLIPLQAFGGGTDWASFSVKQSNASYGHACGIRTNGDLFCAGEGSDGQLGNGTATDSLVPVEEATIAGNWLEVKVNYRHSCARTIGSKLFCWGNNSNGQLGDASTAQRNAPVEVIGAFSDWTYFAPGEEHTCGIRNNGQAWCWGDNGSQQLGDGTTTDRSSPTLVSGGGTNWVVIAAGTAHTCALTQSGQAWCWGRGSNGRLGDNGFLNQGAPVTVQGGFTDWTEIAAGDSSTCGIRAGHLYCWGNRADRTIPDGGAASGDQLVPVEAQGGANTWLNLSMSRENACAIRSDTGKFYCWGRNDVGQVGNNSTAAVTVPTEANSILACDPE